MTSERVQRQIDRLLDEADEASVRGDWSTVRQRAASALAFDPANQDARAYLDAAERADEEKSPTLSPSASTPTTSQPSSFANGRYEVKRFLGEGGKKKVYLAHDSLLDRDVAFALIKTEGLDEVGKERITREAQAMGRLGDHPNIVTVYDIGVEQGTGNKEQGSEAGQPYLVLPLLPGGDIEGLIEKAPDHRLPIEQVLKLGIETCQGLEFAHAKGIVHRDLKPGNVWLDEAGRAKIGDFGLAVAVDRSRLTQAGMMVGTVSYMPPEQAMGGEVTARSDLYSLGAMLYEMVCGRPPFIGDESVAIIGQHLNTPPIALTWHRHDCPPALDALVLRLLEKDPSRRPPDASQVRQALESMATGTAVVPGPGASTQVPQQENPVYRRVFVGREAEVRQLQAAFDAALSGQGGLVMVVGEPGIGKTAVCEQLSTYVAMRGGRTLAGHCYEEGSLSLPYLAFVESMRSYVLTQEPDALRFELGTAAADVARIVSEVRDRTGVELRPAGDPEDDRWRLLQAVTTFLRNASTVQPLLILLEDLHWADRGTLDLLLHVARNLSGARLLIVGNYRDIEVDRSHPLSNALGDLRRNGSFHSIRLRGLSIDEVQRMMTNIRGQDVPVSRAELIHRQTEGNPLFVQEVLRYLVEEGITVRQDGRYQLANPEQPEAGIPEGLRDVIGKRLSRLSPECNRLLAVAAVIGRDFDLATLRTVASVPEEQLIDAIEEAVRIGVLEERSRPGAVLYRFAHAFFRQTLYEEMIAPRRLRLHQEIARALETQYGARREEHAAELAEHFAQSTDHADLAKALEYGELAAQRAMSVYAYAEAASHLERCLAVQEVLDREDKAKRCDLLLALGQALIPAGEPLRVMEHVAEEAFSLAEALSDDRRAMRACRHAIDGFAFGGQGTRTPVASRWPDRADRYAGTETIDRVFADSALALVRIGQRRFAESWALRVGALTLARIINQPEALFKAAEAVLGPSATVPAQDWRWVFGLADEFAASPVHHVSVRTMARSLESIGYTLLNSGDRPRAESLWRQVAHLSAGSGDAVVQLLPLRFEALEMHLDGRLEAAIQAGAHLVEAAERLGNLAAGLNWSSHVTFESLRYLGRYKEAIDSLGRDSIGADVEDLTLLSIIRKGLCLAESGRKAEAQTILRQSITELGIGSPKEQTPTGYLLYLLQLAIFLEQEEILAILLARLKDLGFLGGMFPVINTGVGRYLGAAAAQLGRVDEARAYLDRALEVSAGMRFRPEIALIRLELAELLLEHYPEEHDSAIEHLDFAIAEFREMKMQPSLERALRHRGLLKA